MRRKARSSPRCAGATACHKSSSRGLIDHPALALVGGEGDAVAVGAIGPRWRLRKFPRPMCGRSSTASARSRIENASAHADAVGLRILPRAIFLAHDIGADHPERLADVEGIWPVAVVGEFVPGESILACLRAQFGGHALYVAEISLRRHPAERCQEPQIAKKRTRPPPTDLLRQPHAPHRTNPPKGGSVQCGRRGWCEPNHKL